MLGHVVVGIASTIMTIGGGYRVLADEVVNHAPSRQEIRQAVTNTRDHAKSSLQKSGSKFNSIQHAGNTPKPAFVIREIGDESPSPSMQIAAAPVIRCRHNVGGTMDMYGRLTCNQ